MPAPLACPVALRGPLRALPMRAALGPPRPCSTPCVRSSELGMGPHVGQAFPACGRESHTRVSSDFTVECPPGLGGFTETVASEVAESWTGLGVRTENWSVHKHRVSRCQPPSWAGTGEAQGLVSAGQARQASWAHRCVRTAARGGGVSGTGGGRPNGGIKSKAC